MPDLDFTHLGKRGDGLEVLTRALLRLLKFEISPSGEGPDGGKDMLARITVKAPLRPHHRTWVVECKDNSVAGKPVGIGDVPSIVDRLFQHGAEGFLLVTTTRVTSALTARLDAINNDIRTHFVTAVWDGDDLTRMLLEEPGRPLLQQYFPAYYKASFGVEASVTALVEAGLSPYIERLIHASFPLERLDLVHEVVACIQANNSEGALELLDPLPFEKWSTVMLQVEDLLDKGILIGFLKEAAALDEAEDRRFAFVRLLLDRGIEISALLPVLAKLDIKSISIIMEETDLHQQVERLLGTWLDSYQGGTYDVDGAWLWMMDELAAVEATTSLLVLQADFSTTMNCSVGAGGPWEISADGVVTIEVTEKGVVIKDVNVRLPDFAE